MKKIFPGITLCIGLAACAGPLTQFHSNAMELERAPRFTHQNLEDRKVGIVSATGGNGYRRVLGDPFAKALRTIHPEIPQIPPQEAIGLLNRANLADEYTNMIRDYETSGILRKESLNRIGEALGVGYLIQLSLLQYTQDTSTRFSFLGIRFLETRSSTLRVFAQIWDVRSGEVAWEASSEVTLAGEDVRERPITFEEVATRAWQELIKQLI
ncbi:MAG TPA: hypothetical protein VLY20_11920 [Nitrospiria bacterium]|nr:hypothetical protein [Nitrospiria bacterium]